MRRGSAVGGVLLALLAGAVALAASCTGSESSSGGAAGSAGTATEAGTGGRGSGGTSATGGTGAGGGTSGSGGSATGGTGALGVKCPWEGWYVAPRLPPGCHGLCVPDDVKLRAPKVEWVDKSSWCVGCKWLAKPDWNPPLGPKPFSGVPGTGPGVRAFVLGFEDLDLGAIYDDHYEPLAAWRTNYDHLCGRRLGAAFSRDGYYGFNVVTDVFESFDFVMRPIEKVGELMTATDTTLVFPKSVINQTAPSPGLSFSTKWVANPLLGRLAIGSIATQSVAFADKLPGAPGMLSSAEVVGDVVFARWNKGIGNEWWIFANDTFSPFLGEAGKDVFLLASDGTVIVWLEGSEPVDSGSGVVFSRYDLYRAKFVTDSALLTRELLVAKVRPDLSTYSTYGPLALANGFVTFTYTVELPVKKTDALVVRLSDGRAWRSKLPDDYQWGASVFAGPDELWGAASAGSVVGGAETIVRIPYASMELLQTSPPAGGSP